MKQTLILALLCTIFSLPVAAQTASSGQAFRPAACPEPMVKAGLPCRDGGLPDWDGTWRVQSLYAEKNFKGLDELFEQWSKGEDRYPDGRWRLIMFAEGLARRFNAWKNWGEDLKRIQAWQQASPESFAAKFAEVVYWRNYAWFARGTGFANTVSPEGWALFRERMGFADKVLESLRPRAKNYPAWYPTAIFVKLDKSDIDAATDLFKEGVKLFPEYHAIYFAMSRAMEPRWGGSPEAYEHFANEAATIAKSFEGEGMYLRLFWTVDNSIGVPFRSRSDDIPSWPKLKKGIERLVAKYPSSTHNMNYFASLACRADDKALYLELRQKLGNFADSDQFKNATLEACDLRFGVTSKG